VINQLPTRRPSPLGVWIGLGLVAAGLALIVLAWGLVASEPALHNQVAPLVLAGIGGLAVVIVGLAVVHTAVGRRDEDELTRQLSSLAEMMAKANEQAAR
jgi:hypothetical protein